MKTENTHATRREFIQKAATITSIGSAAPHLAFAANPKPACKPSPNSRIHVGLIPKAVEVPGEILFVAM